VFKQKIKLKNRTNTTLRLHKYHHNVAKNSNSWNKQKKYLRM